MRRASRSYQWLRLVIAVLSVIVGLGAALPAYARLASGPKAHACNCDTGRGHAHCECPICFPELDHEIGSADIALKGRCGEDDPGWRTSSEPAVVPAIAVLLITPESLLLPSRPHEPSRRSFDPPDPRPPRDTVS